MLKTKLSGLTYIGPPCSSVLWYFMYGINSSRGSALPSRYASHGGTINFQWNDGGNFKIFQGCGFVVQESSLKVAGVTCKTAFSPHEVLILDAPLELEFEMQPAAPVIDGKIQFLHRYLFHNGCCTAWNIPRPQPRLNVTVVTESGDAFSFDASKVTRGLC